MTGYKSNSKEAKPQTEQRGPINAVRRLIRRMRPDFREDPPPALKRGEWTDEFGRIRSHQKPKTEPDCVKSGPGFRHLTPEQAAREDYANRPRKTYSNFMLGVSGRMSAFDK